jgi:hypothetical protein
MSRTLGCVLVCALCLPRLARADGGGTGAKLNFVGYGELTFSYHDWGLDENRTGGAQKDSRLEFDTTRFVLELEGSLPYDISFEAEMEFEHGGTGASTELEYEESGEFETEVEKGGEVQVEELYVRKTFADRHQLSLGRIYVAFGQLAYHHQPTDYLSAGRASAEQTLIPAVWNEQGLEYKLYLGPVSVTAQVVNGLDSTAFSSQRWVALGHQARFETVRATDLAGVLRVDLTPLYGVEVGGSVYYGGTSRNRPKADLVTDCASPDPDSVAACAYVDAPLFLAEGHTTVHLGPVRGQGSFIWGHLEHAGAVSARNDRLSNELQVPRTPVSDNAISIWGEVGVDVAPWLRMGAAHTLEPFIHLEYLDTMFHPRSDLFDNPRFARTTFTTGVSYKLGQGFFAKLDWSHTTLGSSAFRNENDLRLQTGFVY